MTRKWGMLRMKYYRDNETNKIITENEMSGVCAECISFAQDARTSVECDGARNGCSAFTELDDEELKQEGLKEVDSFE